MGCLLAGDAELQIREGEQSMGHRNIGLVIRRLAPRCLAIEFSNFIRPQDVL